jgi:hypothetical protein
MPMLVFCLANCSSPYTFYDVSPLGPDPAGDSLQNNDFTKLGDVMVFYSEEQEYIDGVLVGGYSYINGTAITGSGTIKVLVKRASGNNLEEFGLEYHAKNFPLEQINFCIKKDGTYGISCFDGSLHSFWEGTYINIGRNGWNELRIDYNTSTKEFSFFVNDWPLLMKSFKSIGEGTVAYYTSLYNSVVSKETPYRIEFKTTSPYKFP